MRLAPDPTANALRAVERRLARLEALKAIEERLAYLEFRRPSDSPMADVFVVCLALMAVVGVAFLVHG